MRLMILPKCFYISLIRFEVVMTPVAPMPEEQHVNEEFLGANPHAWVLST